MELKDYKKKDFRPFCIEEIKEAFRQGIDPLLIELYMNDTDLDNMQLRQIRLGLESGIDVSAYARKTMFPKDMEQIRLRLEQEKENKDLEKEEHERIEKQRKKGELRKLRLSNTLNVFRILMMLAILGISALLFIGFNYAYELYRQDLFIEFGNDAVTLECGEPFVPEDYVVSRSEGDGILFICPSLSTDELGEFTVTYQLSNGLKSIRKDLKIKVIDSIAPVLTLADEEVALIRNEEKFIPEDYIKEIRDNCDEEPRLEISEIDTTLDEQEVMYTLTDHSGNKAEASLKLILKDRPKNQSRPQSSVSQGEPVSPSVDGNESNSADTGPDSSEPVASEAVKAEVYCHNVTVPLGSDPGAAAYSTYDSLSGNITISIQYPELNTSMPGTYPVYYINQDTGATVAVAYVTVTE